MSTQLQTHSGEKYHFGLLWTALSHRNRHLVVKKNKEVSTGLPLTSKISGRISHLFLLKSPTTVNLWSQSIDDMTGTEANLSFVIFLFVPQIDFTSSFIE